MKSLFSIIIFIYSFSYSQKYFLLDDLKNNFDVKEYTLNAKEMYKTDKEIKMYNIFVSKNNILLLSVLPSLDVKDESWKLIEEKNFLEKMESIILKLHTKLIYGCEKHLEQTLKQQ